MAVVGENFLPPGSVSTRLQGDGRTLGGRAAPPGPKRNGGASSKELKDGRVGHCPYSQDSWWLGSPHAGSPSPWASVHWAPRTSECSWDQEWGREGGQGGPWHPHPALHPHPSALHHPHLMLSAIPFTTASWDPNGFHHGPAPTGVGQGPGPGPDHPHRSPCPKVTMFLLLRCVSPASSLPVLSAASLLFVPLCTLQPSSLVSN